jgi:hypothetical protein
MFLAVGLLRSPFSRLQESLQTANDSQKMHPCASEPICGISPRCGIDPVKIAYNRGWHARPLIAAGRIPESRAAYSETLRRTKYQE